MRDNREVADTRHGHQRGDLEIVSEVVLVALPRGADELRLRWVRARSGDGQNIEWWDLRLWWEGDDGTWKPGHKGITVRARELPAVADALAKAARGAPRTPAPARHSRAPRSETPPVANPPPDDGVDTDAVF